MARRRDEFAVHWERGVEYYSVPVLATTFELTLVAVLLFLPTLMHVPLGP